MDVSKIVYNELQTLEVPQSELSDEGQTLILNEIEYHNNIPPRLLLAGLPEDWTWEWKAAHGTYAGTLSKRLQSFVFKKFQGKLSEETVTRIGNLASEHTLNANTFIFDFDQSLEWHAGDYGDEGSCFWSQKVWSLPMLHHFGAFALRLYAPQTSPLKPPQGMGRALVLPWSHLSEKGRAVGDPDCLLVFNGYGQFSDKYRNAQGKRYGTMQVLDYARLLAMFLGVSYERVTLTINGSTDDPIYINNGGNCILVAPADYTPAWKARGRPGEKSYTRFKVDWPSSEMAKFLQKCSHCGKNIAVDVPIGGYSHGQRVPQDGNLYCDDCYRKMFSPCYVCGLELYTRNRAHVGAPLLDRHGGIYLCDEHTRTEAFRCPYCGDTFHNSEKMYFHVPNLDEPWKAPERVLVCRNCIARQQLVVCVGCTREYPFSNLKTIQSLNGRMQVVIGLCPQCKHKAKGEAPKDGEELPPFLLLPLVPLRTAKDGSEKYLGVSKSKLSFKSSTDMYGNQATGYLEMRPARWTVGTVLNAVETTPAIIAEIYDAARPQFVSFIEDHHPDTALALVDASRALQSMLQMRNENTVTLADDTQEINDNWLRQYLDRTAMKRGYNYVVGSITRIAGNDYRIRTSPRQRHVVNEVMRVCILSFVETLVNTHWRPPEEPAEQWAAAIPGLRANLGPNTTVWDIHAALHEEMNRNDVDWLRAAWVGVGNLTDAHREEILVSFSTT